MVVSTLWVVISILGTAAVGILGVAFFGKLTGTNELINTIANVLKAIWDFVKVPVDFFMHSLPGPAKVVVFILLLSMFGGFIYNVTFGLAKVCDPKTQTVYTTDPYTGFLFRNYPQLSGPALQNSSISVRGELVGGYGNLVSKKNISVDGVFYTDTSIITEINGLNAFFATNILEPGKTQWEQVTAGLLDDNQMYNVEVCMNSDNVCVARRFGLLGTLSLPCQNTVGSFNQEIGQFSYYWDDATNDISVGYFPTNKGPYKHAEASLFHHNIEDCTAYTGNGSDITSGQPELVSFKYGNYGFPFSDNLVNNISIYNAELAEVHRDSITNLNFNDIEGKDRTNMLKQMAKYVPSDSDVVTFSCVSKDSYDTNMLVMGLNPFDVTTVFLITIIGIIIYFILRH